MVQLKDWPWLYSSPWMYSSPWRYWANLRPHAIAIRTGAQLISWQQLADEIDGLAAGFAQQGVTPGCGVVLRGKTVIRCY